MTWSGRVPERVRTLPAVSVLTPTSLDEALAALVDVPTAMVLAGGTDVMVEVNESRLAVADDRTVLSVRRVPELRGWVHDPAAATLRLGAAVTYAELERPPLAALVPALAQAARTVGSPQIRNAATIGGNLATCSPAGDGLPVLAALDAVVEVRSATAGRDVPIADFMVGVKRTALQPGELITAVTVPVLDGWQGYAKVGIRNAMVIAIASACLAVDQPARSVRLALGSVAPTVVRAGGAESFVAARRRLGGGIDLRCRRRSRRPAPGGRGDQPDRRPPGHCRLPPARRRGPHPPPSPGERSPGAPA